MRPHRRARLGIARTFQRLEVFGSLTVRENVLVAAEMRRRWWKEKYEPADVVDEILERVGIADIGDSLVDRTPDGIGAPGRGRTCPGGVPLVHPARRAVVGPRRQRDRRPGRAPAPAVVAAVSASCWSSTTSRMVMHTCADIYVLDFGQVIAHGTRVGDPVRRERAAAPTWESAVMTVTAGSPVLELAAGPGGLRPHRRAPRCRPDACGPARCTPCSVRTEPGRRHRSRWRAARSNPPPGSVMLAGHDVTGVSSDTVARLGVCLVPEGRGIFPNLTVLENLRMATFTGTSFATVQERAFEQFPRLR